MPTRISSAALSLLLLITTSLNCANSQAALVHTQDADQAAGDIFQYLLPALGLTGALYTGDNEGVKEWAKSMGATMVATVALKKGFNSTSWGERPNGGQNSFPSGHTSMACAGATFIGERYGWDLGAAAMVPAALVGWNRVDEDMHHWRDVVAGCALGIGMTMWLTSPENKHDLTIYPEIGDHSFSLGFDMKY
ncbi:MAG: phosphatase PAP2 family protein [Pedobacter sp.]|nr:phosphatase PAP2 family protein [Pedobacter sp.]